MKNLRIKALSVMLAVCMVFTLLPVSASAEESENNKSTPSVRGIELTAVPSKAKVDETVTLTATVSGNNLTTTPTVSGNNFTATVSGNNITWADNVNCTWEATEGIIELGEEKIDISQAVDNAYTIYTVTKEAIAKKAGNAEVVVKINDKEATCKIEVETLEVAVKGVTVDPTEATLEIGATQKLSAVVTPSDATNKNVTWTSSDADVVSVDADGQVTAKKAGKATITVTTEDGGMTADCAITVKEKAPTAVAVTGVAVNPANVTLEIGGTQKLTAAISPSNATNKNVTWSSSNTDVASVDAAGQVTAKKAGSATITVTTEDGRKTASCVVTVKEKTPVVVAVTGVSVIPAKMALATGKTGQLTAAVSPSDATNKNVSWSSSNEKIAKVDAFGKVTAVAAGTATITVTTEDGKKTAACAVTVTAKIGTTKTVGTAKVKVSAAGEVTYTGPKSKTVTSASIPATVKINGQTYKVTEVAASAFANNKKIKKVTIGKNVEKIGKNAFKGCTSVTTVTMGKNVKTISEGAFSGCTKLKKVTTGSTCTSIGKNAFKGCTSMTSVTVGKNVKTIGEGAFSGCKKLKKVNTGNACTSVGKNAFKNCNAMTSVTIGKNVTSIKENAFNGCSKLKTIKISTTKLKSVGKNAFKGINKNAKIKVSSSKLSAYKKLLKGKGQASSVKIAK